MKKYLAFARVSLIEQSKKLLDELGTVFSFCIHIVIFSFLWEFVLEGKALAGYTRQELIWYVIMAEAIMYSFHHYYRKVANKVEMGDFAYDMTKPFNFLARTVVEGLAELPMTFALLVAGSILGIVFAGVLLKNSVPSYCTLTSAKLETPIRTAVVGKIIECRHLYSRTAYPFSHCTLLKGIISTSVTTPVNIPGCSTEIDTINVVSSFISSKFSRSCEKR